MLSQCTKLEKVFFVFVFVFFFKVNDSDEHILVEPETKLELE